MASDLNMCQFIGRLGNDPEIRYQQNGGAVASFSIAVGSQWKDKQTGEKQERTEWVNCSAFGKLAEIIGEYLRKGSQVYVSGEFRTRKYTDNNGIEKYATSINVQNMQMLGGNSGASQGGQQQHRPAQQRPQQNAPHQQAPQYNETPQDFDDSIPFGYVAIENKKLLHCM